MGEGQFGKMTLRIIDGKYRRRRLAAPADRRIRPTLERVREAVRTAHEARIDYLTLFAFSSENWKRPKSEVSDLMSILRYFIRKDLAELHRENVCVKVIGCRESLQPDIRALLEEAGAANLAVEIALPPPYYARRSGEIIAAQLRAVGVDASVRPVEWAEWLAKIFKGHEFDLTIVAHTEPADIGIYARPDYYFHVDNPRFEAVMSELEGESDPEKRIALLKEAQTLIAEDAVNAFLFQLPKNQFSSNFGTIQKRRININ